MPGPPPARSETRRRTNSPEAEKLDVTKVPGAYDPGTLASRVAEPIVVPELTGEWDVDLDETTGEATPDQRERWHPLAQYLWESFTHSGQSLYYQPTDWALASFVCETISRELLPQIIGTREWETTEFIDGSQVTTRRKEPIWGPAPVKGATLSAIMKSATALMATEGDRRRLQLELTSRYSSPSATKTDGTVTSIKQNRKALIGS